MNKINIGSFFMIVVMIYGFMSFFTWALGIGKDSTDSNSGRSGMRLYIDNKTGCHYLGEFFGNLTPRLNADGKQICVGGKND